MIVTMVIKGGEKLIRERLFITTSLFYYFRVPWWMFFCIKMGFAHLLYMYYLTIQVENTIESDRNKERHFTV